MSACADCNIKSKNDLFITMKHFKKLISWIPGGVTTLAIFILLFGYLGYKMGTANMLNTIMNTSHDLLLNTVFYLMAICVLTGAIGKVFVEFGVVRLLEKLLRPLMKPLFNLPGVASLGAVLTFLSDNPAIISLAKDKKFASYFKKYQFISLNNFGTSFGMGLLVIVFMIGQGYFVESFVGFIGAMIGCIVSTRLMQYFVIKAYPRFKEENAAELDEVEENKEEHANKSVFLRVLDSLLDGGRSGVDVGMMIIPGVLVISTIVMVLTFGPDETKGYTGAAYQGVELLPWIGKKLDFAFEWLFGFTDPHLIAFPITAIGAVGAALGLVPNFAAEGWIDGNAIAVFTAIGMCWSGFLSTHTAMLDALGYRKLTSKDILSHTIGGLVAGIAAHWIYVVVSLLFFSPEPVESLVKLSDKSPVTIEWNNGEYVWGNVDADNMAMQKVKVSVPEKGTLTVVLNNAEASEPLSTYGVVLTDEKGNTLKSSYHIGVTNSGTGVRYTLVDVEKGVYPLCCYVVGEEALADAKGSTVLKFESERGAELRKLEELVMLAGIAIEKNEVTSTNVAILKHVYEKTKSLSMSADNKSATIEQIKAACNELSEAYALYLGIAVK